jgi:hypothetical protein
MFLYSVTEFSVRRSFKEYENIKLIDSLLQFKTLCIVALHMPTLVWSVRATGGWEVITCQNVYW